MSNIFYLIIVTPIYKIGFNNDIIYDYLFEIVAAKSQVKGYGAARLKKKIAAELFSKSFLMGRL